MPRTRPSDSSHGVVACRSLPDVSVRYRETPFVKANIREMFLCCQRRGPVTTSRHAANTITVLAFVQPPQLSLEGMSSAWHLMVDGSACLIEPKASRQRTRYQLTRISQPYESVMPSGAEVKAQ